MGHQPRNTDRRHHPNPPAAPQQRTNNSLNFKQLLCKAETHQQLCGRAKTQLTQHYDDMHLMARQQPPGSDSADAFGACDNFLVRHRATKNQVPKCRRRRYLPQPYRQAKAAQMPANSPTSSTLPLTNSRRHVLQHFRNKDLLNAKPPWPPCPDSSHRPLGRPRQPNRVALTPPPCTQLAHSKRRRAARRLGAPTADSKSLAERQTQCAQRAHHRATRRKVRLVIHTRSPQKINSHHSQVTRLAPIRLVKTPRIRLQHFGQDGGVARRVASNI